MMRAWITENAIERITAKAEKLNRKGGNITLKIGESRIAYPNNEAERMEIGGVKVFEVEVDGNLHFAGWTIVAAIDHLMAGNVIRSYEDTMPEEYREARGNCDHCKTTRNRASTIIIRNDTTGEYKQIGKNCLAGYVGVSLDAYAQYLAFETFFEDVKDDDYCGRGDTRYIEINPVLAHAAECIRCFGYVSKKAIEEHPDWESTASRVSRYMWPFGYAARLKNQEEQERAGYKVDEEKPAEIVAEALNWIKTADDSKSDYLHNLKILTTEDSCEAQYLGYIVSLLPTYAKAMDMIKERERKDTTPSNYIGTVGQRITLKVETKWIASFDGMYGTTRIYEMTDETGNILIWKTSGTIRDGEMKIKATVKGHEEYRGKKQTILTRVAEIEKDEKPVDRTADIAKNAAAMKELDEALDMLDK